MRTSVAILMSLLLAPFAAAAGSVSGTVTDAASGAPLAAVVDVLTPDGEWAASASCAVDGTYQVTGLAAGSYHVLAGVPDRPEYAEQLYDGVFLHRDATPVVVHDGQSTTGVDFVLALGGEASGTVRDGADGSPLEQAQVTALLPPDWEWSRSVATGEDGRYRLQGLPPAILALYAEVEEGPYVGQFWDGTPDGAEAVPLDFTQAQVHGGLDFTLPREAVVSGFVRRASDGAPIAGAGVSAEEIAWRWGGVASSAADGRFRIGGLPAAAYHVWAEAPGYTPGGHDEPVTLAAGEERQLELLLHEGGSVAGRVVRAGDGAPVAYGWVLLVDAEGEWGGYDETAADGTFLVDGVPPGRYQLYAEPDEGVNLVPDVLRDASGDPVWTEVRAGESIGALEIALEPGFVVTGRVVAADGSPIADAYVVAAEVRGGGYRDGRSAADGTFRLAGLRPVEHAVLAVHGDYVVQTFDGAYREQDATPVVAERGATVADVDFVLGPAGKISGTVTDEEGNPLEGISVGVFFDAETMVPGAWTETAADGSYTVGCVLPADALYAIAYDWNGERAWQWWDGTLLFGDAEPFEVRVGETTAGVDFRLRRPGDVHTPPMAVVLRATTAEEVTAPASLSVENQGSGPAMVMAWAADDWLSAFLPPTEVAAGDTASLEVTAWTFGLEPGRHTGTVMVHDLTSGSELEIPVFLELSAAPPRLAVEPAALHLDGEEGSSAEPEWLEVVNDTTGSVVFSAAATVPWLAVRPPLGSVEAGGAGVDLEVVPATAALAPGLYEGAVVLSTAEQTLTVPVHLVVDPDAGGDPRIAAPAEVVVNGTEGQPSAAATFEVRNAGTGTLYARVRSAEAWLTATPATLALGPGATAQVGLEVDLRDQPVGATVGMLEIASGVDWAGVEVQVRVTPDVAGAAGVPEADGYLVVPVLARAPGQHGSFFASDLWLACRPGGGDVAVTLAFVPEGADGSRTARVTTLTIPAGASISLEDVVASWLGETTAKGSLVIIRDEVEDVEVTSRTYTSASSKVADGALVGGTYGQEVPAASSADGVSRLDGALHVLDLERSAAFRSNLLLTEVAGRGVRAEVVLYDGAGEVLGSTTREVPPFATVQLNDVFAAVGHQGAATARAEVRAVGGAGRLAALGSTVDNRSNDPTTQLGARRQPATGTVVVPVVASTPGLEGTRWVSDVTVANAGSAARRVAVVYRLASGDLGGSSETVLPPGAFLRIPDIVAGFGAAGTRGSVQVTPVPRGGLVVASRTYNDSADGTYGQGMAAVAVEDALTAGSGVLRLIGLTRSESYRTNLGITEMLGAPVVVGVQVRDASGRRVLASERLSLPAYGQLQVSLEQLLGRSDHVLLAGTATLKVLAGVGGVTAYASMVDNVTGDGTTLPPPVRLSVAAVAPGDASGGGPGASAPSP